MTQDEKWLANYQEAMRYLKENHRNPSKYDLDDRRILYLDQAPEEGLMQVV